MGPKFTCASESEFGEQTEPAFRIDKRPISCKEYELCAAERSCSALYDRDTECDYGYIVVRYEQATSYCLWRRAALPTHSQWVAATIAATTASEAREHMQPHTRCEARERNEAWACEQTSTRGVVFGLDSVGEWARNTCLDDHQQPIPFEINLGRGVIGENVARSAWDLAEFRCVQAL